MKMYDTIKTGLAGMAIYGLTLLPSCTVQKIKTPNEFVKASASQMQQYAKDKTFNTNELREMASTYLRIDSLLEKGVKDEAKKKELEIRRDLLGKIVDGFFEKSNWTIEAYVSGKNPAGQIKNNSGLETGLSTQEFDNAITEGREGAAKTKVRAQYLRTLQSGSPNVMNAYRTDVDNETWHNAYKEVSIDLFKALLKKAESFGAWTETINTRYTDGKEVNGELIRQAFGMRLSKGYTVPTEIAEAITALTPKEKETTDLAKLEKIAEKEAKEAEAAKKKLEEAKAAAEEAKKKEEASKKAEEDKKTASKEGKTE